MTFTIGLEENSIYNQFFIFISWWLWKIALLDALMKLHAVFPITANKLWVRNTYFFLSKLFWTSFKPETACDEWRMVDLQQKRNSLILWSSLDTRKQDCYCPYIGKEFEINDCDAKISFYEYTGILWILSTFCEPKKRGETWVDFVSILYVVSVPAEVK